MNLIETLTERANRPDRSGLWVSVGLTVASAVAANGFVFLVGGGGNDTPPAPGVYDPPGWFVGTVWVVLFALLGAARWVVARAGDREAGQRARLVILLVAFCAAYPLYTLGLRSMVIGLIGNIATVLAAGWVSYRLRPGSRLAAALVLPVVAWVSFATVLTVRMLQAR